MTLPMEIDPATRERAARILARIRADREGGEGTYDDMVAAVARLGAASSGLQRSLDRAHERAERNVLDVLDALAQALAAD